MKIIINPIILMNSMLLFVLKLLKKDLDAHTFVTIKVFIYRQWIFSYLLCCPLGQ